MPANVVRLHEDDIKKLSCVSFINVNMLEEKLEDDAVVFVAFDDDKAVGIVSAEPLGSIYKLAYIFVSEPERGKGHGRQLLKAVRSYDPRIEVTDKIKDREGFATFIERCGFDLIRDVDIYVFGRDKKSRGYLEELMAESGNDLMAMFERHGYDVCSMATASSELMDKLGDEIGEGFDEDMNPFNVKGLSHDWSYIVTKDGSPVSFVACKCQDKKLSVEMLCAHKEFRMYGGAGMAALLSVVDRVMKDDSIEVVKTSVMKEDGEMIKLLDEKFEDLITEKSDLKIYQAS